jgi:RNA polymerase sigma-70 factor (ECF subfamily)
MSERSRGDGPGDRIEALYDRFAASLYRYALMILADPSGAADAVQQVFVALLGRRGIVLEFDEHYLKRAVRNECYSTLRRRRREIVEVVEGSLLEGVTGSSDRPDEHLALERALRGIPPEQREVLHLKVFEGRTFQEIADLSGESINTVASRYRYAVKKLKELLS